LARKGVVNAGCGRAGIDESHPADRLRNSLTLLNQLFG
jgi:hypothetical protein